MKDNKMDKHFTVSVFIVHKDKVLLHLHKKAKKILPVGGHIEINELPQESCIREVKEETGLNINIYDNENAELKNSCGLFKEELLINPMHMICVKVSENHYHIDFVYYARAESCETKPEEGESRILKWYTKEELQKSNDIQANILSMAYEALELLG